MGEIVARESLALEKFSKAVRAERAEADTDRAE